MKTMEDCKFQNMSDMNLVRFLRNYGKTRNGEISSLVLAAANRIMDLKDKIKMLEEKGDDLK